MKDQLMKTHTMTSKTRRQVQEEFAKWKFGLFLHFGMSTFTDSEWASGYEDPDAFAPAKLDCGQWADAAKAAGMQYGVLTTKHTGGWCLWPSAYTSHGIQSFRHFREGKGDLVREFVDAFRSRGLKVGLYYCFPGDFTGYHGNVLPAGKPDLHGLPPEAAGDYAGFMKKQLVELATLYGPDLIWIDQIANKFTKYAWEAIKNLVHETAPECMIIGNCARDLKDSDALGYEWPLDDAGYASKTHGLPGHIGALPPKGNTYPAEVCDSIQTKARWFWHPGLGESDIQTSGQIRETIRLCHARNANYLLNVPPDRDGLISGIHLQRMKEIGPHFPEIENERKS